MTRAANSSLPDGMGLALVMIEEDARRAVHLGDDHALGAVDDERAVLGHERNVAHIDVLFLDVLDRLGAGFLVHIEHDQAQRDLQRRGKGHGALLALLDVVFRLFEVDSRHIPEARIPRNPGSGTPMAKTACSPSSLRPPSGFIHLEELVVGGLLDLDEVGHLRHFDDLAEVLAKPFASSE